MELKDVRKELLFYYESRANPNGDPGFENQPRLMPDGTIIVTDVRIKRTIRDYASSHLGYKIFVDYDEKGDPTTADDRAKEIIGEIRGDVIKDLLLKTFDVPLFGALVTVRSENTGEGGSHKLTGPVQFSLGRSINKVDIINPMISSKFVGKEKKPKKEGEEIKQSGTFGKFYVVDYALIKVQATVNPMNLGKYIEDPSVVKRFMDIESKLISCLWDGTNSLVTRSKYPQRSIFLLEVTYNNAIYNDLSVLVEETDEMKDKPAGLTSSPLKFNRLLNALNERKKKISKVTVASCSELHAEIQRLAENIGKFGIPVEWANVSASPLI
ncbi:MAG: type I CRISPR-associated protein Cas7 [Candidatus Bathyarchaeia archaeon]